MVPKVANSWLILAHLGNGASLCAVKDGRSVASTRGFTGLDGLMMETRCGALDPGVRIHLVDRYGLGARELEDRIYRKSGRLGISGISIDMRTLRASSDPAAKQAIDLFVYRIVRKVGSLAAGLGALDAIVVGEDDSIMLAEFASGCAWLGVTLDEAANRQAVTRISVQDSRICRPMRSSKLRRASLRIGFPMG